MSSTTGAELAPTSVRVSRLTVDRRALVAKSATGRARLRLRREAELLRHMADLPVVSLVTVRETDDRTDLVTDDAGSHDLSRTTGLRPSTLLSALVGTADAVARLHRAGWSHGALCAEHVVLSPDGRVRLCSLGSARQLRAGRPDRQEDLQQLLALTLGALDRHDDPAWSPAERRRWRSVRRRAGRRLRTTGSASDTTVDPAVLGAVLAELAEASYEHGAHRPSASRTGTGPGSPLGRPSIRLVAGIVGFALCVLGWGWADAADAGDEQRAEPVAAVTGHAPPCPAVGSTTPDLDRDGCGDAILVDGHELTVDGTTLRAGRTGDRVAVAPLHCGGEPVVVLLRPSTGEVFAFDDLPSPDRPTPAVLVDTVPGAVAIDTGVTGRCSRAAVRRADGVEHPVEAAADGASGEDR